MDLWDHTLLAGAILSISTEMYIPASRPGILIFWSVAFVVCLVGALLDDRDAKKTRASK